MGISVSMFMIAAGAIMLLIVVGVIGAALSIAYWPSWGGFVRRTSAAQASQPGGGLSSTMVREAEVQARP